jgi:sugar phosphate permease
MNSAAYSWLAGYLNRVNLGNARTLNDDTPADNILQQLNLCGHRYSMAVAFFFIPYVIMEFPGNMLMKYFSPSRWISRIVVSVGFVTMCTAAATTYERLLVARFFLGMAEAGFSSGVMMHLCFWYKPEERATRMAIFASSVALACACGGLLASGISFLNGVGGLAGWQWLFILEGLPAILVGILVWFFLPDYPQTATWLTPHERAFAVKRLGPYAPSMQSGDWEWRVVKDTVADPIFWLFAIQYALMTHALNAFGYFAPTIVSSMGFTGHSGQLLTVPPNIFALIVVVGACLHSDKTRERSRHIVAALTFVATGYLVLATVEIWELRYAAVCVIACTNAAVLPFIAVSLRPLRKSHIGRLTRYPAPDSHCQGIDGNRSRNGRHGSHLQLCGYLSALLVPAEHGAPVQHGKLDDICFSGRVHRDEPLCLVRFRKPQRL